MEIMLFERELEVMQVLWDRDSAMVAEVRDALTDEMAYTTVLTVLRRLEEKGFVSHDEDGRAYRYHALVQRWDVRESALERLVRQLFGGSPGALATHLVSRRKLEPSDLHRLRELVDRQLRGE